MEWGHSLRDLNQRSYETVICPNYHYDLAASPVKTKVWVSLKCFCDFFSWYGKLCLQWVPHNCPRGF